MTSKTLWPFMHELHSRLYEEGRNTVSFPFGVVSMLGVAANGSGRNTRREILRVLGISRDSEVDGLNSMIAKTADGINKLGRISMGTMICRSPLGEFTHGANIVSDTVYLSTLAAMDYSKPNVEVSFNGWAKHSTKGNLDRIVDHVDEDSSLLFLNAAYVSSQWGGRFKRVGQMGFQYGSSGLPLAAEFMVGDHVELQEGPMWDFLKIPYESGSRTSMIVIRPKSGSLRDLGRDWDMDDFLAPAMPNVQPGKSVSLAMPRFRAVSVADDRLKLALVDCGLTDAVMPGIADFTDLVEGDPDAHISKIVQAAAINVDAAARGPHQESSEFKMSRRYVLDSPFLGIIVDELAMMPLCMVSVNNPNLSQTLG